MATIDRSSQGGFQPDNKEIQNNLPKPGAYSTYGVVQTQKSHRSFSQVIKEWKWELSTWVLGTLAVAAIVALLVYFRKRPVDEWDVHKVQLSTAVAAFSQVASAALLHSVSECIGQLKWSWLKLGKRRSVRAIDVDYFDDATRGPKGSLAFLWRIPRAHLAYIGAIITLLMLGFSSFTQQAVTTELRNIRSSEKAQIGRAVQYFGSLSFQVWGFLSNSNPQEEENYYDLPMISALQSGMIEDFKSPSNVTGLCEGDFCTWDEYTTIAMCTSFEEITTSLYHFDNDTSNLAFSVRPLDYGFSVENSGFGLISFWMTSTHENLTPVDSLEGFLNISDVYLLYYPPCDDQGNSRFEEWSTDLKDLKNWQAYKATFNVCLQTLNSTYNSSMQTKIIETRKDFEWHTNSTGNFCTSPADDETYCIGTKDVEQFQLQFKSMFNGSGSFWPGGDNYYSGRWVPIVALDVMGPDPTKCDTSPSIGMTGFQRRVDNIAMSITNTMRLGNTSISAEGTAWKTEQYFSVTLYWLIGPIALYILSTFLLFSTVFKSRNEGVPLWKSSTLPLLHCTDRGNGMNELGKVEDDAAVRKVDLKYTGEDWVLQGASDTRHV
ncbi:hypothetical protein EJ04DRAFT_581854 [Polyplosphaeria fusca]|uniref:Uncharacterized protein n=1 Tax=Polyplosphaeria fusca TaxID=682080 RepID=A0A9P4QMV4_9PLEO|nr:hypothetical protein EJ04DRAFT_581854 [Polyplosphaeria fusca]